MWAFLSFSKAFLEVYRHLASNWRIVLNGSCQVTKQKLEDGGI